MLIKGRNSKLAPAIGLALCITALAQAGESPRHNAVVEAVSRVMPGVVNIATKTRVQRVRYYYDWWRDNWAPYAQELPPQESAGSGVVVDASGYVLTNVPKSGSRSTTRTASPGFTRRRPSPGAWPLTSPC